MEPQDDSPFTPRERRGLAFVLFALVLLMLAIFLGLNIFHIRETARQAHASGTRPQGAGS